MRSEACLVGRLRVKLLQNSHWCQTDPSTGYWESEYSNIIWCDSWYQWSPEKSDTLRNTVKSWHDAAPRHRCDNAAGALQGATRAPCDLRTGYAYSRTLLTAVTSRILRPSWVKNNFCGKTNSEELQEKSKKWHDTNPNSNRLVRKKSYLLTSFKFTLSLFWYFHCHKKRKRERDKWG